jgi:hypothetical protein
MPSDPVQALQAAARRVGCHLVPSAKVGRVVIHDDAGNTILDVMVPPGDVQVDERGEEEVKPGWDFSGGTPRFNGDDKPIYGRPLAVLKNLARTAGPVPVEDLRAEWDGYQASDSTIRGTVAELKKKLAKLFPDWEGDAVTSTGGGYKLEIR